MAVNDRTDPEVLQLMERMEEYRQVSNFGPEKVDADRALKLYKKDDDFMAYDPAPPTGGFLGWSDYWDAYHKIFDKYSIVKFDYGDDTRIVRKSDVAWVSTSAVIQGKTREGADFLKEIRGTLVWVKEGADWLVAQEHWSACRQYATQGGEVV